MAKVEVLNWDKKKVGEVDLNAEVFEQPVRKDLLHTVVRWQLAKRRSGTHKAKTRAEVSGGGKKPFKQKGTGNARQGSTRSPLLEGGGVIHGPAPRDYTFRLTKKVKQAGLKSALSYLFQSGKLQVVDAMGADSGKTKEVVAKLKSMGLEKAFLVSATENEMFKRASRNMTAIKYVDVDGLNVYDLLKFDRLVMTEDALAGIYKRCGVEQ